MDARATLDTRHHDKDEAESRIYQPQRGARYDLEHDHRTSPEHSGPRVFSKANRRVKFPVRQTANLTKYSRETNPELWLAHYCLACQLGGTEYDFLIVDG